MRCALGIAGDCCSSCPCLDTSDGVLALFRDESLTDEQIAEQHDLAQRCWDEGKQGLVPLKSSRLAVRGEVLVHLDIRKWWEAQDMDLTCHPDKLEMMTIWCNESSARPSVSESIRRRAYLKFARRFSDIRKAHRD